MYNLWYFANFLFLHIFWLITWCCNKYLKLCNFFADYWGVFQKSIKSIYKFGLSVCLFVCLFVSNKRQNGWTDRAQNFCGTSCDPREGLWMIKFSKICLYQNSIFKNFGNPRNFFWKSAKFFFVICLQGEALCILFLQMK